MSKKLCKHVIARIIFSTFEGCKLIGESKTLKRLTRMPKAFSTVLLALDNL